MSEEQIIPLYERIKKFCETFNFFVWDTVTKLLEKIIAINRKYYFNILKFSLSDMECEIDSDPDFDIKNFIFFKCNLRYFSIYGNHINNAFFYKINCESFNIGTSSGYIDNFCFADICSDYNKDSRKFYIDKFYRIENYSSENKNFNRGSFFGSEHLIEMLNNSIHTCTVKTLK